jgi:hypothetical protein
MKGKVVMFAMDFAMFAMDFDMAELSFERPTNNLLKFQN